MPFRYNAFGEAIAQPGTDFSEIADLMMEVMGISMAEPTNADLFTEYDPNFKIGGELTIFGQNTTSEEGEDDPLEATLQFDNFGTIEAAHAWLYSIGCGTITEVK